MAEITKHALVNIDINDIIVRIITMEVTNRITTSEVKKNAAYIILSTIDE